MIEQKQLDYICCSNTLDVFFEQQDTKKLVLQLLYHYKKACRIKLNVAKVAPTCHLVCSKEHQSITLYKDNTILFAYRKYTLNPTFFYQGKINLCTAPFHMHKMVLPLPITNNKTLLTDIPPDIMMLIFSFLSIWDLRQLQLVCRYCYKIASRDALWKGKWTRVCKEAIPAYDALPQRTQFAQYHLLDWQQPRLHPAFIKKGGFWLAKPANKPIAISLLHKSPFMHRGHVSHFDCHYAQYIIVYKNLKRGKRVQYVKRGNIEYVFVIVASTREEDNNQFGSILNMDEPFLRVLSNGDLILYKWYGWTLQRHLQREFINNKVLAKNAIV